MLVGPAASKREIAAFRKKLEANPANYIAQPTLSLSTVPIFTKAGLAPRHVDLRPFVLMSPQGLTITPDRKSTRLNSSHSCAARMPPSACKQKSTDDKHEQDMNPHPNA